MKTRFLSPLLASLLFLNSLGTTFGDETKSPAEPNIPHVMTKKQKEIFFQMWLENGGCFSNGIVNLELLENEMEPALFAKETRLKKNRQPNERKSRETKPDPVTPVQADLSGTWRVFLPAGFEKEITLTAGENGEYHLTPGNLTIAGPYQLKGARLVSKKTDEPPTGQFFWKVNSPYLITLTKQTANVGSDYTGAVMFRNRDSLQKAKPQKDE